VIDMDARVLLVGGPSGTVLSWMDELVEVGATVKVVTSGVEALRHHELLSPDVVLMDVRLEGELDGFDTCRAFRSRSDAIVVFASESPAPSDEVVALAVGGDLFLPGGTPGPIVIARMKALLRRARGATRTDSPAAHGVHTNGSIGHASQVGDDPAQVMERVTEGDLVIDLAAREVFVNGKLAHLSRLEFDLLVTLARDPRRVFTREQLMVEVWDEPFDGSHVLDTQLSRLRCKIAAVGGERVAHAVRGVGFRLRS
jgi:DNA-binding response OmpR family regulator